jgi:flagellar biosynthesis/type III secretory pathway chaperone
MSATFVDHDVISTLEELLQIYRRLETTAHGKRQALGSENTKALQAILQEEQQLIHKVEDLENQRIAHAQASGAAPLRLSGEIAALDSETQGRANELFAELRKLARSVELLNRTNSEVLEHLLHFIDYNFNLLVSSSNAPQSGYGRSGDDRQSGANGLIDRKI